MLQIAPLLMIVFDAGTTVSASGSQFPPYDKLVSWPMYMCAYVLCGFHMVTVYLRPLTLMRSIAEQSGQRLAQVCCTITAYKPPLQNEAYEH